MSCDLRLGRNGAWKRVAERFDSAKNMAAVQALFEGRKP